MSTKPAGQGNRICTRYTPEERRAGLTALALCSGNRRKAEAMLKEQGIKIPESTLYDWSRRIYPDEYQEICAEVLPRLKELQAEKATDLASYSFDTQFKVVDMMNEALDSGEITAKDLSKNLHHLSLNAGIAVDKAAVLRGETEIHVHTHDIGASIKALVRMGVVELDPGEVIDAVEATEVAPERPELDS